MRRLVEQARRQVALGVDGQYLVKFADPALDQTGYRLGAIRRNVLAGQNQFERGVVNHGREGIEKTAMHSRQFACGGLA